MGKSNKMKYLKYSKVHQFNTVDQTGKGDRLLFEICNNGRVVTTILTIVWIQEIVIAFAKWYLLIQIKLKVCGNINNNYKCLKQILLTKVFSVNS